METLKAAVQPDFKIRRMLSLLYQNWLAVMRSFNLLRLPSGMVVPAHAHPYSQISILLKGEILFWESSTDTHLVKAGGLWRVRAGAVHSARVENSALVLRYRYGEAREVMSTTNPRSVLFATLLTLTAIPASGQDKLAVTECNYGLAELARDQAEGFQFEVPDCFFNTLESAAAGGNVQAQVELGVSLLEGLHSNPAEKTMGPYWLKRAANEGHPSAQALLDAYMEDIAC